MANWTSDEISLVWNKAEYCNDKCEEQEFRTDLSE